MLLPAGAVWLGAGAGDHLAEGAVGVEGADEVEVADGVAADDEDGEGGGAGEAEEEGLEDGGVGCNKIS